MSGQLEEDAEWGLPDVCCGSCKHWGWADKICMWTSRDWGELKAPFWMFPTEMKTKETDGQDCKGWEL